MNLHTASPGRPTSSARPGWWQVVTLALAIFVAVPAAANAQSGAADQSPQAAMSAQNQQRFKKLSEELRCLVCQNQTLADSNAGLALDLRRQVESLMNQGMDDAQIKDYLVQRYGDFVLYRPPVKASTLLLWFGPFCLLAAGLAIWILVQRRSGQQRAQAAQPDADARQRARDLLD
ncbi:MAG: cytochrome c-type biogenesis protein [Quisquiliibacterium sp.]